MDYYTGLLNALEHSVHLNGLFTTSAGELCLMIHLVKRHHVKLSFRAWAFLTFSQGLTLTVARLPGASIKNVWAS